MDIEMPLYPMINDQGLDAVDLALANEWLDNYIKVLGLIIGCARKQPVHGQKWADGMVRHYMERATDMLENIPKGIEFEDNPQWRHSHG